MDQNSRDPSNQSKKDLSFSRLLNSSIEYPTWVGKFYSLMGAFYNSNWTDKFDDENVAHILLKSWYMALKEFPEEFILDSLMEYHHTHEFAPNSPSSLIELMRNKYRQAKQEIETKQLQADANLKRLEHEVNETKTAEELAHHGMSMADLDKMRIMMGLPPFDENKLKVGESALNDKGQLYLNIISKVDILMHTQ